MRIRYFPDEISNKQMRKKISIYVLLAYFSIIHFLREYATILIHLFYFEGIVSMKMQSKSIDIIANVELK